MVREIKARKKLVDRLDPSIVFAAMPPVEAPKAMLSHLMSERTNHRGRQLELMIFDISRAHFYGKSKRKVYTTLPEGYEEEDKCALLLKTMYGTEDAASIWHETWSSVLKQAGFAMGVANSTEKEYEDFVTATTSW